MANLLKETIWKLADHGLGPNDVKWVGNQDNTGTWQDFVKLADFDYDDGFGIQEINAALLIVGKNWWLERVEYDGSESWSFQTQPNKPISNGIKKEDLLEPSYSNGLKH